MNRLRLYILTLMASIGLRAAAQFNPEIDALMAYMDSMKHENTDISMDATMWFKSGPSGLECTAHLSSQYLYIDGTSDSNPEKNALQKQKMEEMLNRVRQTLDRLSKHSIESTHWEIHGQNADTLNYAMYLRPAQQMFSLRNSTDSRYSPSAAFGGEYINMQYTANRNIPYYSARNYKKDEQTGQIVTEVDSSVVTSMNRAQAYLSYTYYLDSAFVNNPTERGVQLFVTPFNPEAYCEAIQNVFNRPGVVMRQVHYYIMDGGYASGGYQSASGAYVQRNYPFIKESDTYGLHYIIKSEEIVNAVMADYWKATIDYMMAHPYENCQVVNPYRTIFKDYSTFILYGKHSYRVYPSGLNSYYKYKYDNLCETDYFDVWTAYSKGYYHILLLKTDGSRLNDLPKDWETIRDYDNGVVSYYEEDKK